MMRWWTREVQKLVLLPVAVTADVLHASASGLERLIWRGR